MALSDLIESDVTNVMLNTSDFAESVTRELSDGRTQTVTALVAFVSVERNHERGDQMRYDAEMTIDDSQAVARDDVWLINSERYKVENIGKPQDGMLTVELRHIDETAYRGGPRA